MTRRTKIHPQEQARRAAIRKALVIEAKAALRRQEAANRARAAIARARGTTTKDEE